jgi:hypothetical protein
VRLRRTRQRSAMSMPAAAHAAIETPGDRALREAEKTTAQSAELRAAREHTNRDDRSGRPGETRSFRR